MEGKGTIYKDGENTESVGRGWNPDEVTGRAEFAVPAGFLSAVPSERGRLMKSSDVEPELYA